MGVLALLAVGFTAGLWFSGKLPGQTAQVHPSEKVSATEQADPLEQASPMEQGSGTPETSEASRPPSVESAPQAAPQPDVPTVEAAPLSPPQQGQNAPVKPVPDLQTPTPQTPGSQSTPSPQVSNPRLPANAAGGAQPLDSLNAVRRLAGLPPVGRNSAWQAQCGAHARYLALADRGEHREDPASPYRTADGEACAHGHYFVSSQPASGAARAMTYWATGAFHLPQLLDPRLTSAAFAVAHDTSGDVQSAAVLDVRRGLTGQAVYPVRFPASGRVSPLSTAARFEWPDPIPGCAGYAHPVGAPVALLLGYGQSVRSAAIKVNGKPVAACLLTAQTFTGASESDTRVGRNVLASQGAALLLPRKPLPAGASVRVSFSTSAGPAAWTFKVGRSQGE